MRTQRFSAQKINSEKILCLRFFRWTKFKHAPFTWNNFCCTYTLNDWRIVWFGWQRNGIDEMIFDSFSRILSFSLTKSIVSEEIRQRSCAYAFRRTTDGLTSSRHDCCCGLPFSFVLFSCYIQLCKYISFFVRDFLRWFILSYACAVSTYMADARVCVCVSPCITLNHTNIYRRSSTYWIHIWCEIAGIKRNSLEIQT